jgi:hypothetical protein
VEYLRVSTILEPFIDWTNIPVDRKEYAAERGTQVHRICLEGLARGIWIPHIPEDCKGYVKSFEIFLKEMVVLVVETEIRLYDNDYGYTGQLDLICQMLNQGIVILDLKTPITKYKVWQGALAAYKNLAVKNGYPIRKAGTLQLDPKGGSPKVDWLKDEAQAFQAFLCGLHAVRWFSS